MCHVGPRGSGDVTLDNADNVGTLSTAMMTPWVGVCSQGPLRLALSPSADHQLTAVRDEHLVATNFVKYRKYTNSGGKFCICDYLYL